MKNYDLTLEGLAQPSGQIRALDFVTAVNSLVQVARRTTLLIATGTSQTKASKYPPWVVSATDFVISNLRTGSTTITVDAPLLFDSSTDQFKYKDLWAPDVEICPEDSALDLVCDAIVEAKEEDSRGNRYDDQVLSSILSLENIGAKNTVAITISSRSIGGRCISLDTQDFEKLRQRRSAIPLPSVHAISGVLDRLQYSKSRFQLHIGSGKKINGTLANANIDRETLRPLWGRITTVVGKVHFTANGDVRMIEAQEIRPSEDGEDHFRRKPRPLNGSDLKGRVLEQIESKKGFDPRDLARMWPGDEPLDLLLDQLKR